MANSRKSPIAEASPRAPEGAGAPVPDPLEHLVAAALSRAGVGAGARVAVALSGGADSMALLEIIHRLRAHLSITPMALHVHHGLSPHAGQWAQLCRQACAERDLPFELCQVHVRRAPGASLEECARDLRYQCFARCDADVLLLAHHLDDQCETFLLRLLRGAGLHGLAAMPVARPLPDGPLLLRPLLAATRAQLRAYATRRALKWIEDESNDDRALTRNYLRAEVLPRMAARFPGYRQVVARAVDGLSEAAHILDELAGTDLQAATLDGDLQLDRLAALGDARALNALRAYLMARGCRPPARAHLWETWRQLRDAAPDARVRIRMGEGELRRYRGQLSWHQGWQRTPAAAGASSLWQGEARLTLPAGMGQLILHPVTGDGVRAVLMRPGEITVCQARGSMRLKCSAGHPSRSLKNLFQEAAVPPWVRAVTPVLRAGDHTLWVAGLGYDCRYRAAPAEAGLRLEWVSALPA